jgi:uncharacterized phage protein gp47/JayE
VTAFQKSFDELLNEILTDWRNQFPGADTSQGSLIFIRSACLASALWGLYKYQAWIAGQIFPDTAETELLEHHAWVRGLTRSAGETDAALLARLLNHIRKPPAGGNKNDYEQWALSIDHVAKAWCFPLAQGLGTVDVVILASADTGSEIPSSHARTGSTTSVSEGKLVDAAANFTGANPVRIGDIAVNDDTEATAVVTAVDSGTQLSLDEDIFTAAGVAYTIKSLTVQVKEYINSVRPVTASIVRILPPDPLTQAVSMTVSGSGIDRTAIAAEIAAYMNSLIPGEVLYKSRLVTIAIQEGATDAVLTVPATDVTPAGYGMIRPGTITIA